MQRFAIRLAIVLAALLVASQFALPPFLANQVEDRLTAHGGTADVKLRAFPSLRLLTKHGRELDITASGLSVDLEQDQQDVFQQLDDFRNVDIDVSNSRAGPFTVRRFQVKKDGGGEYGVLVSGDATAGDVARYAGDKLAGGFGQALAGLAASALGNFDRAVPFNARMHIETADGQKPRATDVQGQVAGFPAGPLAQIVANALLSGL